MRRVAVVTDSSSNLPADIVERYAIIVVPLILHLDGRTYRDGVDLTADEVYAYMRAHVNGALPTTASPSPDAFLQAYAAAGRLAPQIVSIHVSSRLSGTYQTAVLASRLIDVPVHVVDSRRAAMACGFMVMAAARAAAEGADVEEVLAVIENARKRCNFLMGLDQLYYLHRGGRVPAIAAIAGAALRLAPILHMTDQGEVHIVSVARTRRGMINRILDLLEKRLGGMPAYIAVSHADAPDDARTVHEEVCRRVRCLGSWVTSFTPVMGAHAGPGLIGISYYLESGYAGA
jgi:DegV family protein with EDD domain